jgi:hypothetical protein
MIEVRSPEDPDQVGGFRVIGRLGAGGFGTVYVAGRGGRLAAVKVMQSRLARDHRFRDRFGREISAIGQVASRYVPRLIDHGVDGEVLWLATELVPGPSLSAVVRQVGPLPERTVWRLALDIATGLRDIHRCKVVHRDLKPGNVLLVPDGPRIIDFGLVHLAGAEHQTESGLPMCSPEYAPPEQRRSLREADKPPSDIFTLGGTLLFAATGHPPYGSGRDPWTAPPNLANLPSSLYDVVAQCLCDAEEARPGLADLLSYFEDQADGADGAFAAAPIRTVIDTWRRELDEAGRLSAPGAAPGAQPAGPDPRTELFHRGRDDGPITVPEPAPMQSRPADGQGAELQWRRSLGDWIRAPVAVTRDAVVAASLGGVVAWLSPSSGNVLGRPANLGVPVRSAVLPPGSTSTSWAYAASADGVVYGIDLASGQHWAVLYASGAIEGPPVVAGDRLYVLSADGCVYEGDAYGSGEGAVLCELGRPALGALAVTGGVLVAASAEGCAYAIDLAAGTVRWRVPTDGLLFGAPAVAGDWLYFAGTDGQLRSVRADTGRVARLDIGVPVHAAPVHDRGRLYLGGGDGRVRAFDIAGDAAGTPRPLWTSREIGEVSGITARGGLVVAAAGRTVTALDGVSGERSAWSTARTLIAAAPVITGKHVYVASLDGTVCCLSLAALPFTRGRGTYRDGGQVLLAGT